MLTVFIDYLICLNVNDTHLPWVMFIQTMNTNQRKLEKLKVY